MFNEISKISIWGILFQFFCTLLQAQGNVPAEDTVGNVLKLQQAIDIGIKNNLMISQSELQLQTSRNNTAQARANLLPVINGAGNQTIGFGRTLNTYDYTYTNQVNAGNYGINGYLNLFSGLQAQNNIRQSKYTYEAGKMNLQQQKENLKLDILLAYLEVISSKELLEIAREQSLADSVQVERLKVLNQEGALLLLSNLSDLKGKYADDKVSIAVAANNLESARINLFGLLNVPYKSDVVFEYNTLTTPSFNQTADPKNICHYALAHIPSVQSARFNVRAYEKALLVAKGQRYPNLSITGSITTNYYSLAYDQIATTTSSGLPTPYYFLEEGRQVDIFTEKQNYENQKLSFGNQFGSNRAASVGIQLTIPLLNSLRTRNAIRQAKANLSYAQINEKAVQNTLQRQVEQAYQNSKAAWLQYKSYLDETEAYRESFRITQIRFNEGIVNADAYVLAKNNLDRANINLIIARYKYIFHTKVLDYYQGQPEF